CALVVLFYSFCVLFLLFVVFFFFFQAEDGIRDRTVTGVQTCALPISIHPSTWACPPGVCGWIAPRTRWQPSGARCARRSSTQSRSEERRVGKECRSRWWP